MRPISVVLGTRPELIKLAPLLRRLRDRSVPLQLIHTNQHYDHAMDGVFFEELDLPLPTLHLSAAAPTHGEMLAKMFMGLERAWHKKKPSIVVVQGDTNSAFAGAFIASRLGIEVAHVEAGLRSDDRTMPEEVNRVLIDQIASRLYVPTSLHRKRALAEGIGEERILITGNTIEDAVREHLEKAGAALLPKTAEDVLGSPYGILTLHRPALVDDARQLETVLSAVDDCLDRRGIAALFLVHPRTDKRINQRSFRAIRLMEPVGYLPMLRLLSGAKVIITDSGGLQEEASLLKVPCVTARENTERPETVAAGGNRIAGIRAEGIVAALEDLLTKPIHWKPLYETSGASDRIMEDLLSLPCVSL